MVVLPRLRATFLRVHEATEQKAWSGSERDRRKCSHTQLVSPAGV